MAKKVAATASGGFAGGTGGSSVAGKIEAALTRNPGLATVFTRKIGFKEARRRDDKMEELAKKYKPLNVPLPSSIPVAAAGQQFSVISSGKRTTCNGPSHRAAVHTLALHHEKNNAIRTSTTEGIPQAGRVLFDPACLSMKWKKVGRTRHTSGLVNSWNTCFMNASLQCLAHVPPFAEYVRSGGHSRTCRMKEFCAFCELEKTMIDMQHKGPVVAPASLAKNLSRIAPSMRLGNHEDAHEFVINLFDCVQKSCLRGEPKDLNPKIQETTFMHQAFGGYVRNQVKCLACNHESNTYEAALDLSLDLPRDVRTVDDALRLFTKAEILDDPANLYRCDACKKLVKARRRTSIHRPPRALQVHLKRFAFRMVAPPNGPKGKRRGPSLKYMKKEGRIEFPEQLDLAPYLSGPPVHAKYELSGVVVHHGQADYGHYFAYVRAANGDWLRADDSRVVKVRAQKVFDEDDAYMLYYTQTRPSGDLPSVDHQGVMRTCARPSAPPSEDVDFAHQTSGHPTGESVKPVRENGSLRLKKTPALRESSEEDRSDVASSPLVPLRRRPAPVVAWDEPLVSKKRKLDDVMEREREAHERRKGARIIERMLSARDSKAKVFAGAEVPAWTEESADTREFASLSKETKRKRPSQWDIEYDAPKPRKNRRAAKERRYAKFREANPFQARQAVTCPNK